MTAAARRVLADCRLVLSMLEEETDPHKFRVLWAAALVLIRTVGDVLIRIDGRGRFPRPFVKERSKSWLNGALENAIFKDFIKHERDQIVHEYCSDLDLREKVPITVIDGRAAYFLHGAQGSGTSFETDENIFRPIATGAWAGEDGRDVSLESIEWWEREIAEMEAKWPVAK